MTSSVKSSLPSEHTITGFVLRYRDPSTAYWRKPDEVYVALDQNSGGYPYQVGVMDAKMWTVAELANEYSKHFPGQFELVRLTFKVSVEVVPQSSTPTPATGL